MTDQETLYMMALAQVPSVSQTNLHLLIDELGTATAIYENRKSLKELLPAASQKTLDALASIDNHLKRAEEELQFCKEGKNVFLLAKTSNKSVAIFSLEMSREQLALRLLSSESFIHNKKLQDAMAYALQVRDERQEETCRKLNEQGFSITMDSSLEHVARSRTLARPNHSMQEAQSVLCLISPCKPAIIMNIG